MSWLQAEIYRPTCNAPATGQRDCCASLPDNDRLHADRQRLGRSLDIGRHFRSSLWRLHHCSCCCCYCFCRQTHLTLQVASSTDTSCAIQWVWWHHHLYHIYVHCVTTPCRGDSPSSTTVAHRIGNIGSTNPMVKSVSPNNKGFPYFGLSQFLKTNSLIFP